MTAGKKILIAEDERAIANALKLKLEKVGYSVESAYNGNEAIEKINGSSYDLILLDLLMPEADGWTVLESIKGKNQKVIVTSNLSQEEDINKAKEMGAVDFFVKSEVSLSEIVSKVQEYLK